MTALRRMTACSSQATLAPVRACHRYNTSYFSKHNASFYAAKFRKYNASGRYSPWHSAKHNASGRHRRLRGSKRARGRNISSHGGRGRGKARVVCVTTIMRVAIIPDTDCCPHIGNGSCASGYVGGRTSEACGFDRYGRPVYATCCRKAGSTAAHCLTTMKLRTGKTWTFQSGAWSKAQDQLSNDSFSSGFAFHPPTGWGKPAPAASSHQTEGEPGHLSASDSTEVTTPEEETCVPPYQNVSTSRTTRPVALFGL